MQTLPNGQKAEYLGDGVYALSDPHMGGIWLHANDHLNPTDRIYIDASILDALNRFSKDVNDAS